MITLYKCSVCDGKPLADEGLWLTQLKIINHYGFSVIWIVKPCSLIGCSQRFGATFASIFRVKIHIQNYMKSQPTGPQSISSLRLELAISDISVCPYDGASKHLWNVGQFIHFTDERARRQPSPYSAPRESQILMTLVICILQFQMNSSLL
jgi:hypothetical protein